MSRRFATLIGEALTVAALPVLAVAFVVFCGFVVVRAARRRVRAGRVTLKYALRYQRQAA